MTSKLASLLVQDGLVTARKVAEAFQRQVIYGGTLDTILLEMDALDEEPLLDALERAYGLPTAGEVPALDGAMLRARVPQPLSERYRAVPVGVEGELLRTLVLDPPERQALDELGLMVGAVVDPLVATEYRFAQAVELVYEVPVPARLASLAAKLAKRAGDGRRTRPRPVVSAAAAAVAAPASEPAAVVAAAKTGEMAAATTTKAVAVPAAGETAAAVAATKVAEAAVAVVATKVDEAVAVAAVPGSFIEALEQATERAHAEQARAQATELVAAAEPVPVVETAVVTTAEAAPAASRAAAAPVADAAVVADAPVAAVAAAADAPVVEAAPAADVAPTAEAAPVDEAAPAAEAAVAPEVAVAPEPVVDAADTATLVSTLVEPSAPAAPLEPERSARLVMPPPRESTRVATPRGGTPTALSVEVARRVIDEAEDRDAIFQALCRGARARLPFVALLTVHGESAVGRLALGASWFDRATLAGIFAPLDAPSPFRATVRGRAPYLGRLGDDPASLPVLAGLGRKPPLPALLMPIVLRERAVALLYADADGADLGAEVVGELSTLTAAAARRFQQLILRAKSRDVAVTTASASGPDLQALVASVLRQDAEAAASADVLAGLGERAATAVVAELPGPLRLDRHALRGPTPPLREHGPLLGLLGRLGSAALVPLYGRLGDHSLEVRYYVTLALGELGLPDVVPALGTRLHDPDAGVRRAAVDALGRAPDSPALRTLVERLRAELPGPDEVRQRYAAEALGALHDVPSVPRLIELARHDSTATAGVARHALVEITKQDFGSSRWRWRGWWERHRDEPRLEWMLEGLGHAEAEVRRSAFEELRALGGDSFGYAVDLPKREREDARKKWSSWWRAQGVTVALDKLGRPLR